MKIHRIEIKNVLGIEEVSIEPKDSIIELTGETGTGKTSILRAIKAALGGRGEAPKEFIRAGESCGTVKVWIGNEQPEFLAELQQRINPKTGEPSPLNFSLIDLQEKKEVRSPQTYLNEIGVKVGLDFLKFLQQSPTEQIESLRRVVVMDVDLDKIDGKIAKLVEDRIFSGREEKALAGTLEIKTKEVAQMRSGDIPDAEVSATDLNREIQAARDKQDEITIVKIEVDQRTANVQRLRAEIEQLRERLDLEGAEMELAEQRLRTLGTAPEIEPLLEQFEKIEKVNQAVRARDGLNILRKNHAEENELYKSLTTQIETLRAQKLKAFQEAKMPVEGMTFDSEGIRLNGILLTECAGMEQFRVALGVALGSGETHFPLLIADSGDQLGGESFAVVEAALSERGAQLFITTRNQISIDPIIIEGGKVKQPLEF